jgi:enhanced filamentous growth protein 1
VSTRGPIDIPYYNHHAAQRPLYVNERLPSLPLPLPQQAFSSGTSSPRVGSLGSSSVSNGNSNISSFSSGPKTPSPTLPADGDLPTPSQIPSYSSQPQPGSGYAHNQESYASMNQQPQDMYYNPHMSSGQAPAPQTITSGGMTHYSHHQQPPLLQPGPAQYSPAQGSYGQYGNYSNGLTSPQQGGHQVSGPMGGQGNVLSLPPMAPASQPVMAGQGYASQPGYDTTGQLAPPGMKPRVTATLWEDEGSLCFQVEAKGVCVARREGKCRSYLIRNHNRSSS